jgi:O-antigen ligase
MDYFEVSVRLNFDKTIIKDKWARASGVWGNANKAGAFCLINIFFLMYFSLKYKLKTFHLFFLFAVILFLFYNIYLTLSNTIIIASIFIIFLYVYFFGKQLQLKKKIKIILISFVGIMVFLLFYGKSISQQYPNLTPAKKQKITNVLSLLDITSSKKVSFSDRDLALEIGFEKIFNRPIFGNGLGSFKRNLVNVDGIHNQFIQILGEGGIFSFFFFLMFLIFMLLKATQTKERSLKFLLYSFLIFFTLYGMTTHGLFIVNAYCIIFALFFVLFEKKSFIAKESNLKL